MGLLCDYFAAPSDEEAATTIDWEGGPSKPEPESAAGYQTLDLSGIDPVVQMATLEEILTGRTFDEIMDDPSADVVVDRDEGERLVVRLSESLQSSLASSNEESLRSAAADWAETEEFWGEGDPNHLAGVLASLAKLASDATASNKRLYCWVCV